MQSRWQSGGLCLARAAQAAQRGGGRSVVPGSVAAASKRDGLLFHPGSRCFLQQVRLPHAQPTGLLAAAAGERRKAFSTSASSAPESRAEDAKDEVPEGEAATLAAAQAIVMKDPEKFTQFIKEALVANPDLESALTSRVRKEMVKEVALGREQKDSLHKSMRFAVNRLELEFEKADKNHDGYLSMQEFGAWAKRIAEKDKGAVEEKEPTTKQLQYVFLRQLPPFIGFGFVDNSLMIISGEAIDGTLGFYLGISTMAAAALGNAFSNGIGMCLHGVIERFANKLGMPDPKLTLKQMQHQKTTVSRTIGSCTGIIVGCIFGMCPLLFKSPKKGGESHHH